MSKDAFVPSKNERKCVRESKNKGDVSKKVILLQLPWGLQHVLAGS